MSHTPPPGADDAQSNVESPAGRTPELEAASNSADTPLKGSRPPITDSPWFWLYVFACVGVALLFLAQPRFSARQTQIERKYQGRMRAAQNAAGQDPTTPMSEEGDTQLQLWPILVLLAAVAAASWILLWRNHFRDRRPTDDRAS